MAKRQDKKSLDETVAFTSPKKGAIPKKRQQQEPQQQQAPSRRDISLNDLADALVEAPKKGITLADFILEKKVENDVGGASALPSPSLLEQKEEAIAVERKEEEPKNAAHEWGESIRNSGSDLAKRVGVLGEKAFLEEENWKRKNQAMTQLEKKMKVVKDKKIDARNDHEAAAIRLDRIKQLLGDSTSREEWLGRRRDLGAAEEWLKGTRAQIDYYSFKLRTLLEKKRELADEMMRSKEYIAKLNEESGQLIYLDQMAEYQRKQ